MSTIREELKKIDEAVNAIEEALEDVPDPAPPAEDLQEARQLFDALTSAIADLPQVSEEIALTLEALDEALVKIGV